MQLYRILPIHLCCATLLSSAELVVDGAKGDDAATGTAEAPLRTINRAAQLAEPGDTVSIRAGIYRESVRPAKGGTEGRPITYRGLPGGAVVVSGADPLPGWTRDGQAWRAPLPGDAFSRAEPLLSEPARMTDAKVLNQADQVFVDGRMMVLARWPDLPSLDPSHPSLSECEKFLGKSKKDSNWIEASLLDADNALTPAQAVGAEIFLQPNHGAWSWSFTGVVTAKDGGRLTLRTRNGAGKDGNGEIYDDRSRYVLFNKRELMDQPGEWWHDKRAGMLWLMSPDGKPPEGRVEVRRRVWGFDLSGLSHLVIRDLALFACSITTDAAAGGDNIGYEADGSTRYPWRNTDGAGTVDSMQVVLDHLDIRYPSHFTDVSGHFFLQWGMSSGVVLAGMEHTMRNCTIRWSAGNGVSIQGPRHTLVDNLIEDCAYWPVDCAAINTTMVGKRGETRDCEIGWNTIRRTGRSGLSLRTAGNGNAGSMRIHHNEVVDFMIQDWDGGAFYVPPDNDGQFARIDHNRMWCDEPRSQLIMGAYWDFSRNWVFDHNVVWGVPRAIQMTRDLAGRNNMVVYRNTAVSNDAAWGRSFGDSDNSGSLIQNNIFKVCVFGNPNPWMHFPLYNKGIPVGNLVFGAKAGAGHNPTDTMHPADIATADPLLDRSWMPQAGSPAIDAGRPLPTFIRDQIRVRVPEDAVSGSAPDLGAYEVGQPAWTAGRRTR